MTILQQAEFIDYLANRALSRDDRVAAETLMYVTADDIADLRAIADRLHRMAPHEPAIRRAVVGK